MSMEKMPSEDTLQEAQELSPFVPSERLNEFNEFAEEGRVNKELAEQLGKHAKEKMDKAFEHALSCGVNLGGLIPAAFLGPVLPGMLSGPLPAILMGVAGIYHHYRTKKIEDEANNINKNKRMVESVSQAAYGLTREIVEQELRKMGACDMDGQFYATPEQIKITKEEMDTLGGKKLS